MIQQETCPPVTNKNSTQDATSLTTSDKIQNGTQSCEPTNETCHPVEKPVLVYCPDGYHKSGDVCKLYLHCDVSKYNNCPPTICILNKDCPSGFTCSNGYNIKGINGDCRLKIPCDSSNVKCPPDPCNVFKGDCKPVSVCVKNSTNSTNTSCYPPKNDKLEEGDNNNNINTQIIKEQVSQQPSNALIPIDTIQFCDQIGD